MVLPQILKGSPVLKMLSSLQLHEKADVLPLAHEDPERLSENRQASFNLGDGKASHTMLVSHPRRETGALKS